MQCLVQYIAIAISLILMIICMTIYGSLVEQCHDSGGYFVREGMGFGTCIMGVDE